MEITDTALDQMMAEPKLSHNPQLKRRTRTTEKDLKIEESTATDKEKVNLRKSRKDRARAKSIDLPDMIMHLAAKATALL